MKKAAAGLLLAGLLQQAQAFSLLGPFPAWQTVEIGYQLAADLGGPMNLAEEYRYNFPTVAYAFDPSFLNYFGAKGVEEVEKAIAILNDLPTLSTLSDELREYPLNTRRFNHQASALRLYDLKSYVLGALLEQLGLAAPERYVWTLRARTVIANIPYYSVIRRNIDPETKTYSPYVNGVLYTYQILLTFINPNTWEAVPQAVDPTLPTVTSVAAWSTDAGTIIAPGAVVNIQPGLFYTGLTRDDVGGLRYLYRRQNYNVSVAPAGASGAPVGVLEGGSTILDSNTSSPWGPPGGGTNTVGTNLPIVTTAIRPGIDKLQFVRVDFDSLLGAWITVTNRYTDTVITNGVQSTQVLDRTLAAPDILFTAADVGITPAGSPFLFIRTKAFQDNSALNGNAGGGVLAGPGTLGPGDVLTFSKLGQSFLNIGGGGEVDALQMVWWASYDGTTNAPFIYPQGTSIEEIERLVSTGESQSGSPWAAPPLLLVGGGGNTNFPQQAGTIGGGNPGGGGGTTP